MLLLVAPLLGWRGVGEAVSGGLAFGIRFLDFDVLSCFGGLIRWLFLGVLWSSGCERWGALAGMPVGLYFHSHEVSERGLNIPRHLQTEGRREIHACLLDCV